MKKALPLTVQLVILLCSVILVNTALHARNERPAAPETKSLSKADAAVASDPPAFPEVPADTTANCISDVLPPPSLLATDDNDPSFPKLITAVDTPSPATIGCAGGVITRSWTATDVDDNTTTVEQVITILPDNAPPVITAPEPNDFVNCDEFTESSWNTWLNSKELTLATQIDECNLDRIESDAPASFDTYCGSITVTFTVIDECGASTDWPATLTVIDETPPVFSGVPAVNDTISCSDPIPSVPMVTATDNCTEDLTVQFQENSGQQMDGSCNQYEYVIIRTWSSVDSCGNLATASHRIVVRDNQSPSFTRPPNITISCTDDPADLSLTGDVTDAIDNCDPAPEVTFLDAIVDNPDCPQEYQIQRTWLVKDVCGNTTGKLQIIDVEDAEAPSFDVPEDLVIDCSESTDPAATGMPANVADNCDIAPVVTFSDVVMQGDCLNEEVIQRLWNVRDACGNFTQKIQQITITDNAAPVMDVAPADLILDCAGNLNVDSLFTDWWTGLGGAVASDNCTLAADLDWAVYNNGTNAVPSLPPLSCPAPGQVLRERTLDFVVSDECGNSSLLSATFRLVDMEAPQLQQCPPDQIIATDSGDCAAVFTLVPPAILESCAVGQTMVSADASGPVTTSAPPGQAGTTPVDPVDLTLVIAHPLPINATDNAALTIRLRSVNAAATTEYFNVLGEDGSLLGRTALAPIPSGCGDSDTTLIVPAALLSTWAADGAVSIRLEPNVPANQSGAFAINAICDPAGLVEAELSFTARDFTGLRYEYRLNGGPRIAVNPVGPVDVSLPAGIHQLRYYATDCGGNTDSCSYQVTVQDTEPPSLSCPPDLTLVLAPDECTVDVALPFPAGAADNCSVGALLEVTAPADTASALLTYALDPNLNSYLAQARSYTFNGLSANAGGPMELTLSLLGGFTDNGAFLEVYGDDGSLLGNTVVGVADCNTPGEATFTIPQATYNEWASDGSLTIVLQPNDIVVPPGVPGDGINPCNPGVVTFDGDNDGESYVFATLSGPTLQPSYFATGATPLPLSTFAGPAAPMHTFQLGETTVSYIIADEAGNLDTCAFQVEVLDNEMPVARCLPTTLFINPAGTVQQTVDPMLIDDGSSDNCAIDTMFLTPGTFDCNDATALVDVTLTVIDLAGNADTCGTFVRVELEEPAPTSNAADGLCAGDTLCLFASPPSAPGGVVYTYAWTGPSNFMSSMANPCIPNVTTANAGTYTVTITGITGCTVSASVEVAILGLPSTPQVLTEAGICINEDIELVSSVSPSGQDVIYRWYEGIPPNGVLLAETMTASYTIPGPHPIPPNVNTRTVRYYLEVERDGCFSETSPPVAVTISRIPTAQVNEDQVVLCEGGTFTPGTPLSEPDLNFEWNGPDGYFSTNPNPAVISPVTPAKAGPYVLTVFRNGCPSAPDTTLLTVIPKPPTPDIFNTGPACVGENIVLSTNVTNASSYEWQSSVVPDPIPTSVNTLVLTDLTLADAVNWRVRVTQAGCVSDFSASTSVVVNPLPPTVATAVDESVCESDTIRLLGTPNVATYSYQWIGPAGFASALANPVIAQNVGENREGNYVLQVTTDAGCSRSDSVFVEILPGVSILGLSNNGQECVPTPTDVRLVSSVFPPDDGTYQYLWTPPVPGITIQPDPTCQSCAVVQGANEEDNGIYRLVVLTADGCASEADTTLVFISAPPATPPVPQVSSATPAPFCEGEPITLTTTPVQGSEVIYYWQLPGGGTEPTTVASLNIPSADEAVHEGLYSVRVSVGGCLSAQSPEITINVRPVPDANPLSNSPVCSGDTLQLMTPLDPGANYFWTGPQLFSSALPNPFIANAGLNRGGYYRLQAELNGCFSALDSVLVVVNPSPQTPVTFNDGPLCIDQGGVALTLSVDPATATNGALYTWQDADSLLGETPFLNFTVSELAGYGDGPRTFTVQATLGDCVSQPVPTEALLNTIPNEVAMAGADTTLCEVDDLQLDALLPVTGEGNWSVLPGSPSGVAILDPGDHQSPVEDLIGGETYGFVWTLSNGACLNYDQDTVLLSITPGEVPVAGEDIKVCITDQIILNATPTLTGTGMWSQPGEQDSLGVSILNPFDPNTRVTGLNPDNTYIFTWSVVSGCGAGEDDVLVIVSDPNADAGRDTIICDESGVIRLQADPPTLGSTGVWTALNPEVMIDNPASPAPLAMNLSPGINRFVWTIDDGLCGAISVDTMTVTRKMPPRAFDDAAAVPFGQPLTIDVLENDDYPLGSITEAVFLPAHGELQKIAEGRYVYRPDITFAGVDEFRYRLCSEGCECSEASVLLTVGEDAACEIPNVITPNGDGVNDIFVVPCLLNTDLYPESQVSIFNRWGDEVFRSGQPYQSDWEGTFNGEDLPNGTYFYLIDFGTEREPATGFVMIQR